MKRSDLKSSFDPSPILKALTLVLFFTLAGTTVAGASPAFSIARDWDEQILSAIRNDTPHPPVHARNLFSLSVCLYAAWAASSDAPVGYFYRGKPTSVDVDAVDAAWRESISYAASRTLRELFVYSKPASNT